MNNESIDPTGLETAIRAVYRGPFEEFVGRRDALVRQLRASGKRADAARVKALRKPGRVAWALDTVVFEDPAPIEQLAAAITAAQTAHSGGDGGAVRTALEDVRNAVRAVADAAARAASRAGHPIELTPLVAAVNAVIGDANAFADLRTGRLVDLPDGGGLDILTAMAPVTAALPSRAAPGKLPETRDAELAAAARAELQRAEAALTAARKRLQAAERTVSIAQAKVEAAEQQLQRARDEADTCRNELDGARRDAGSATTQVADAERAVAAARGGVM